MSLTVTAMISEPGQAPAPRRSAREKRPTFQMIGNKRKHIDTDIDNNDNLAVSDVEIHDNDDSDAGDDYIAPRRPKPANRSKGKAQGPPVVKRPRVTKGTSSTPKAQARKGKKQVDPMIRDAVKSTTEAKILEDNALFNMILNPVSALQSVVEDYLESFRQSPEHALADLINCILRCCGSNDSVDSDRVVDYDGIVDALDDFTEVLKDDEAPTYPLTSRHPTFKKFRKSLAEFLNRLIASSAELGTLYSSDLLMTIQAWVIAMSSSQLRSFRHTATVIALEIETALCETSAAVEKEAEVITRQREGERKRKAKGSTTEREKEFEAKAVEVKDRRTKLSEFLKEFFDGVFIHRYRDLDPNIRAECVHAMGDWLKKYPAHYLDGQYLRYIGWVLSDANNHVRLEAAKALVALYTKDDYIVSLQSFTERFKPRLVEMATGDTDLSIRVTVVQVLCSIDAHGLLDEDQRAALCLLVFDADAKVRRAVSSFVHGVWNEAVEQRLIGKKKPSENEKDRAGLKALAQLLVQWGRASDRASLSHNTGLDNESNSQDDGPSSRRGIDALLGVSLKGRIALAIEALWDEVPSVSDWEAMLDLLLLDHSAGLETTVGGTPVSARRKKTKKIAADTVVDEAWKLDEAEEAILLEVLTTALRKSLAEVTSGKKGEEDSLSSAITRALIKSLPSLIAKHQTDENRIANVLLIPEYMNMDMFLEMRMISAYEALWDDIIKQCLTHSSSTVLTNSVRAIQHLMNTTSLSNTNNTKILELEDELASSLRDAVGGRDELEVATFSDDEAGMLGAICARICAVMSIRDLTAWMDEDEGGKQSSAWDIMCALAERGRLGYKEEDLMVDRSLHLLTLHVIWKARNLMRGPTSPADIENLQDALREQRDTLLEKLMEYAVGTQSNALIGVRRTAFQNLLTLHILFSSRSESTSDKELSLTPLSLSMADEVQYRCAGFIQAEIERYADDLEGERPVQNDGSNDDSDSSDEVTPETHAKSNTRPKKGRVHRDTNNETNDLKSKSQLEQEYIFNATIATFLRALRAEVIDVRHSSVLLAHYGRLGSSFDLSAKIIVDILREEGMYNDNGIFVVSVIEKALKDSFTLFLDRVVDSEKYTIALSKALVPCLMIRGAQLSVLKRLPSNYVVEIHTTLVSWIVKQISMYDVRENKRAKKASIIFFRVLLPLLVAIESKDALKIKAHLDQDISQANIEASAFSKVWEPYRAYEKRLVAITTKEKGANKKGKRKAAQIVDLMTDDEEEVEEIVKTNGAASQSLATPRPRPLYRKEDNGDVSVSELSQHTEGDEPRGTQSLGQLTQTNGLQNGGSSHQISPSQSSSPFMAVNMGDSPEPRKRVREELDANEDLIAGYAITGAFPDQSEERPSDTLDNDETIIRRKKRVRH